MGTRPPRGVESHRMHALKGSNLTVFELSTGWVPHRVHDTESAVPPKDGGTMDTPVCRVSRGSSGVNSATTFYPETELWVDQALPQQKREEPSDSPQMA